MIPYRYTQKELKELLKSLIILIDTREQKNQHITNYFEDKKISYKSKKLDWGDYSFMLPENPEAGIMKDIYFNKGEIAIERKRSLNELSNNFTHDRTQFENELIRSSKAKFILLVEDVKGYQNIINHNYQTDYQPKSFIGTLQTFRNRYGMDFNFINPDFSGNFIYFTFYYFLRERLK